MWLDTGDWLTIRSSGRRSPYVPLPSHDEAMARLVFSIERQQRFVTLFAEAGLGKTTVRAAGDRGDPRVRGGAW